MKTYLILSVICLTVIAPALVSAENTVVPYPDDYRNWKHVKSMLIQPGHQLENPFQGIHHVYANDKALSGLETGQYADGAVLAFDLLEYTEADKTIQESLIQSSNLTWTIVRPGVLCNFDKLGGYKILDDPKTWRNGWVTRANVARFLIIESEDETYKFKTPIIVC